MELGCLRVWVKMLSLVLSTEQGNICIYIYREIDRIILYIYRDYIGIIFRIP